MIRLLPSVIPWQNWYKRGFLLVFCETQNFSDHRKFKKFIAFPENLKFFLSLPALLMHTAEAHKGLTVIGCNSDTIINNKALQGTETWTCSFQLLVISTAWGDISHQILLIGVIFLFWKSHWFRDIVSQSQRQQIPRKHQYSSNMSTS